MKTTMIAAGVACLQMALASAAWAQPKLPFAPTESEILLLPEECRGILKGGAAAAPYYQQLPGLVGPNHYCFGLNFVNRAKFTLNKTDKRFYLQSAINEFDYPLKHSAPDAAGLQQIRALQAEAAMMLRSIPK